MPTGTSLCQVSEGMTQLLLNAWKPRGISGGEVIAEFRDMESRRKADRSGLAAALTECRVRWATLLIAKLDRLARSVPFVMADMPDANRLTIHVRAAAAKHERGMIGQRTRAALAAVKARGTRLRG